MYVPNFPASVFIAHPVYLQGIISTLTNLKNPETVSTDYDEADRLYFENISLEVSDLEMDRMCDIN